MNIKENIKKKSEELIRKAEALTTIAIKRKHPLNSPTCSFSNQSYSCSFIV